MIQRSEIAKTFYIDDHAAVYGLLAKAADQLYAEAGMNASAKATILYASERGRRMAKRAIRDGYPLTPGVYRIYTEWADERKQMKVETLQLSPNYRMNGTYCVWNETWKRYGLGKYGKIYCTYVDQTMVKAFNPDNELIIHSTLSLGGAGCDFEWPGLCYENAEELKADGILKQSKRQIAVKDFLYHCGHTVSAMGRGYALELGQEQSDRIVCQALEEYCKLFGEEKAKAVIRESEIDFEEL
ncbi:MAG: L-2-amino-thiazoline-4-carboxylic acid hydrolase [Enterocloster asparagiformis]|nr:L-2-amino-thiazoline-4-carboxylic acid hydrolase [Enterocloster asparagiformis]